MRAAVFLLSVAAFCAQLDDPGEKARRARDLVNAGKAEEAIPIYQELARAFPKDAGMLVNLSVAEFKAKRYGDAAGHAEAAVKLEPESLAANLFLGSSYVELGQYLRAVEPLDKVIAAQPNERNARAMLGEALLALDRYDEASDQFQKACDLAPANPKVWYGLGRSFEALSDRAFHRLEGAHPESPYWHALVAGVYLKQRRYGSAFVHYRLADAAAITLPGVHAGLAAVYKQTGHAAWARTEEEREHRGPQPDCSAGGLACYFMAGRYREIAEAAKSAATPETLYWASKAYSELALHAYDHLAQSAQSLENHLHAAKTFDAKGLYPEAAGKWREALKLAPDDAPIRTALVWSLFRARDCQAALPLLRELLDKQHGSSEINFLYGASLMNLEQPEKALPYLETAVRLDEQFLPAQTALGQALLRTGQVSKAITHLKAAMAGDEDGSVHFQLLRAYQLTGQTDLAKSALAEYQEARRSAEARKRLEEGGEIMQP
jgi:predicted Zn-dependent protease